MAVLTQGTQIYVLAPTEQDPSIFEVLKIDCPTSFDPGTSPADQIEVTCMEDTDARAFLRGLRSPGEASLTINADPRVESHVRLFELAQQGAIPLKWAVGWSDGKDIDPTEVQDSNGDWDFDLPSGRSWFVFDGYISDFPFSFELNSVVQSTITIQRSGPAAWYPKV